MSSALIVVRKMAFVVYLEKSIYIGAYWYIKNAK